MDVVWPKSIVRTIFGILGAVDLNSFGTKIKKIYNIENACNFMPI